MSDSTVCLKVRIKNKWLLDNIALPVILFFARTSMLMGFSRNDCYTASMNIMCKLIMVNVVVEQG